MTDSAAVSRSIQPDIAARQWLALALTPAMGPIRGHRLVQNFGGVEPVFQASLTELEAAGLPAVSGQSIALGKSYSAAEEEFIKARDVGAETRCALEQGREISAVPGSVTDRNSGDPNTLITQGAKLTATWEDVWEELPTELKLQLEAGWRVESTKPAEASLSADSQLSPHEKRVCALLKPDEAVQLDHIIEQWRARYRHQRSSLHCLN